MCSLLLTVAFVRACQCAQPLSHPAADLVNGLVPCVLQQGRPEVNCTPAHRDLTAATVSAARGVQGQGETWLHPACMSCMLEMSALGSWHGGGLPAGDVVCGCQALSAAEVLRGTAAVGRQGSCSLGSFSKGISRWLAFFCARKQSRTSIGRRQGDIRHFPTCLLTCCRSTSPWTCAPRRPAPSAGGSPSTRYSKHERDHCVLHLPARKQCSNACAWHKLMLLADCTDTLGWGLCATTVLASVQAALTTEKQQKKDAAFPKRRYAVKA